jgi:hypothetical protein
MGHRLLNQRGSSHDDCTSTSDDAEKNYFLGEDGIVPYLSDLSYMMDLGS